MPISIKAMKRDYSQPRLQDSGVKTKIVQKKNIEFCKVNPTYRLDLTQKNPDMFVQIGHQQLPCKPRPPQRYQRHRNNNSMRELIKNESEPEHKLLDMISKKQEVRWEHRLSSQAMKERPISILDFEFKPRRHIKSKTTQHSPKIIQTANVTALINNLNYD